MRILMSFGSDALKPNGNPYVAELTNRVRQAADVATFSWSEALFRRYDLLHLHWPEHLVEGRPAHPWRNSFLLLLLTRRIRIRKIPVVWTVHNSVAHGELRRIQTFAISRLKKTVTYQIFLTPQETKPTLPYTIIPHGHYRDSLPENFESSPQGSGLIYFGPIQKYKGVAPLIHSFLESELRMNLSILGSNRDGVISDDLLASARTDPRLTTNFEHVPQDLLYLSITEAESVILPYEKFENSGAALLGLSLNRPIIVPKNRFTDQLREEFSAAWVIQYEPPLTGPKLYSAVLNMQTASRDETLDMQNRDWDSLYSKMMDAYNNAINKRTRNA